MSETTGPVRDDSTPRPWRVRAVNCSDSEGEYCGTEYWIFGPDQEEVGLIEGEVDAHLIVDSVNFIDARIAGINARIARLTEALRRSVKLQSHYAELLNMADGGDRLTFASVEGWLNRLDGLGELPRE